MNAYHVYAKLPYMETWNFRWSLNILSPMLATRQGICIWNIAPQITDHCLQTGSFTFHSYVWSSLFDFTAYSRWNCLLLFESMRKCKLHCWNWYHKYISDDGMIKLQGLIIFNTPSTQRNCNMIQLLNLDILFNTYSIHGKFVTWYEILNLDIL